MEKDKKNFIGQNIRLARTSKGLQQKDLGKVMGVSGQQIGDWERGLCIPKLASLQKLSAALGLTVEQLAAGKLDITLSDISLGIENPPSLRLASGNPPRGGNSPGLALSILMDTNKKLNERIAFLEGQILFLNKQIEILQNTTIEKLVSKKLILK